MAQTLIVSAQGSVDEIVADISPAVCPRQIVGLLQFSGRVPSNPRYVNIHTNMTNGFFNNGVQNNMISHITNITDGTVNINYEPAHIKWCTTYPGLANVRHARFWFTDENGDRISVDNPDLTIQIA